VPRLEHIIVIVFENRERSDLLNSGTAPTFVSLARRYAEASNYRAVAHPSLPNYLALVSGSTYGVRENCIECSFAGPTIGDQLTQAGLPWSAYAEGYPSSSRFAKRHVPFLYFPDVPDHVVRLADFAPRRLPAFSLVIPDLCHDMHDCPPLVGDGWLRRFIKPLLTVPRTAVFVAFDEGTTAVGGGGHVPFIAAGTAVLPHSRFENVTSHYGLLRTIELALGLPALGRARGAPVLTGIWR
jgi:hypothetical protein